MILEISDTSFKYIRFAREIKLPTSIEQRERKYEKKIKH